MSETVLKYFKARGRVECVCFALELTGEKYVEKRHDFDEWPAVKAASIADGSMPFGQCPLLHIDGMDLVQSLAILRYIGRKHNIQGKTLQDIAFGDMLIDSFVDMQNAFYDVKFGDNTPENRQKFIETKYNVFMPAFSKLFEKYPGKFFLGDEPTIVDCVAYTVFCIMKMHYPDATKYDNLEQFMIDFAEIKPIKEYIASDRRPTW
ncbi:hypothetical protein WA158_005759 [Blastocystis sp. Blastoise]